MEKRKKTLYGAGQQYVHQNQMQSTHSVLCQCNFNVVWADSEQVTQSVEGYHEVLSSASVLQLGTQRRTSKPAKETPPSCTPSQASSKIFDGEQRNQRTFETKEEGV
jgi:hypothetical protein